MARRVVMVEDERLVISPLEAPPAANRHCALMLVSVRDEVTGRPPLSPLQARLIVPANADVIARAIDSGLIGVTGRPSHAFPPLAPTATLQLEISARGYTTRDLKVTFASSARTLTAPPAGVVLTLDSAAALTVGQRALLSTADGARLEFSVIAALGPGANDIQLAQSPSMPYASGSIVQPLPADQTLPLHRNPIAFSGRVLKQTAAGATPLANASVIVNRIWRVVPAAGTAPQPELPVPGGPVPPAPWPVPVANIEPPCYTDFAAGDTVEFENRAVDGAMPEKTLLDDSAPLDTELRVSDAILLNLNDVLIIDADDPARSEIVEVTAIRRSFTDNDWARITLNQPLAYAHRRERPVRRLQNIAPAFSRALNYDAARGDSTLLMDATAVAGTQQVRIVSAAAPVQHSYHRLTTYAATSDANGFYRLPPLMRVGKLELFARDPVPPAKTSIELTPEPQAGELQVDLIVS